MGGPGSGRKFEGASNFYKPGIRAKSSSNKIWVINRETGHDIKIKSDQLIKYQSKGYVKGGSK